jgi:hypothetical protein
VGWNGFREDGRSASMIGADPYQVEAEVISRIAFSTESRAMHRSSHRPTSSVSSDDGESFDGID